MMSCWISVHACTNCTYSQFFYAAIKIYLDHIIILSVKYLPLRVIHPLCTACARSLNRKAKEHFRTLVGFLLRELDHCSSQMTLKKKLHSLSYKNRFGVAESRLNTTDFDLVHAVPFTK